MISLRSSMVWVSAGDRLGASKLLLAGLEGGFDLRFCLVKLLADDRSLRRLNLAQKRLQLAETTVLAAKKLNTDRFERRSLSRAGNRRQRGLFVRLQFADWVQVWAQGNAR
jgi:hypothetical protein